MANGRPLHLTRAESVRMVIRFPRWQADTTVIVDRDWLRMLLSTFYHGTDMHLYYNMISLLYKGSWLEKKFGTPYFLFLIGTFTALINSLYVALGMFLAWLFEDDSYLRSCAVGFSGVLFALKVLTTHYSPRGPQLALGIIRVPSTCVYWAELVLIQLLVPNASFVGHLAGILIGVAYTYGPLKPIMDFVFRPEGSSVDAPSGVTSPNRQSTADGVADRPAQPVARPREPSLGFVVQTTPDFQSSYLNSGHLAGTLIGIAYTYGPLKPLMDLIVERFYEVLQSLMSGEYFYPGLRADA